MIFACLSRQHCRNRVRVCMRRILSSGLPGTGKSTLAEAVGRRLSIPVFAKVWPEATLLQSELVPSNPDKPLGSTGYQRLTMLAERQLKLGQCVILNSVARTLGIRQTWLLLAKEYQAETSVIECVCSDEAFHRSKICNANPISRAGMNWNGRMSNR
jgi:predicted kinase